jgi:hypothetical protein
MPEMQPSIPATPALPTMTLEMPASVFDDDYAFGCECANPALQIAQWRQEARSPGAEAG